MAHEISSIALAHKPAWHGLGTVVPYLMTTEEALRLGQLDWEVQLAPLVAVVNDIPTNVPGKNAVYRTDSGAVLGVVGDSYRPIQNRDAFGVFDTITGVADGKFEVVGSLGRGERVWLLGKLPGEIRIVGTDDLTEKYLLLFNSHDGTRSLTLGFTSVRVVCANTLAAAFRQGLDWQVTIRHSVGLEERVKEAQRLYGLCTSYFTEANVIFNRFAEVQVTSQMFTDFLDEVLPLPKVEQYQYRAKKAREQVAALFESSPTITAFPKIKGTAWAAFNSVSEFSNHAREFKNRSDKSIEEARFDSITAGSAGALTQKAYDALAEVVAYA